MAIILDDIKKVTKDLSVLSVDDGRISEKLKSVNKSVINKMSVIDEKVNQIKTQEPIDHVRIQQKKNYFFT